MEQIFEIVITGIRGRTWQGSLRRGGESVPFRSELELLRELDRLLPAAAPAWDGPESITHDHLTQERGTGQWRLI